jgi:hypothetical protein
VTCPLRRRLTAGATASLLALTLVPALGGAAGAAAGRTAGAPADPAAADDTGRAARAALVARAASATRAKQVARRMLPSRGRTRQFRCLDPLWTRESNWNVHAGRPSHSYGIPQANPGVKMHTAGPAWRHDAATQIRWGLRYIRGRYGSPCGAWRHWQRRHWY